ncbi:MAG TPA: hypothetical protein VKY32_08850 [Flavobacterium sp.]|nr:hypothetical protein [Flavobacterium sp.]
MKKLFTTRFRILAVIAFLFFVHSEFYAQTPGNIDLSFGVGDGITVNTATTRCLAIQ